MAKKLISYDVLKDKGIPYSRPQLWRKVRDKTFPAPVRVGVQRIAWVEAEIDKWIEQRIAERDRKTSKQAAA